MIHFCLWDEPWIPVILPSGETATVSIREALLKAHELREVYDPSPLVTVAIHRLLLAVLYRVYHPHGFKEWAGLWRAGSFDPAPLDAYGAKWAERFDLLHPTHPFYQVPRIEDEEVHPITWLIMEAASGNNPTLFDHGQAEGGEGLTPGRAACHLLAQQLFAVGGGVSKPFNRMDGPLTKGLVVEAKSNRSLFETLSLNLMPLDRWTGLVPETVIDRPFWEEETPPEPDRSGTVPRGPLHYLTWQSRQIHLCVDDRAGIITGCQFRQRYCLPKDGRKTDPWKPHRKDKKEGWQPFKLDREKAAWQFTHVLLQEAPGGEIEPPGLVEWLAEVTTRGNEAGLSVPPVIALAVSGLATDPQKAAKIELWRREVLPLPAEFLKDNELVGDLRDLILEARKAEALLQLTGTVLAWGLGERHDLPEVLTYFRTRKPPGGKVPDQFIAFGRGFGMVARFWPALEAPFRRALAELPEEDFATVRERWRAAVRLAAGQAFQGVRDGLIHAQAPYEVLTQIDHCFHTRLANLFATKAEENEGGDVDDPESDE
ncbi:MAG: type I-E CRISPR-associated protein Cse1/CasA [Chitinophagales bacterium]